MKVTYSWLNDLVSLKMPPEKLAQKLTMAGLSVASLERVDGDWVYDIEVTSNRPDWLSVRGIAREVAAVTGAHLKKILRAPVRSGRTKALAAPPFSIIVEDRKDCRLYCGALIDGIAVGPSPAWMQKRLNAVGLRPINNVVDITNYVLMEFGQPLHAFDRDKLDGAGVVVRRAKAGERLALLDGTEKALSPQVLVIADAKRPVAVAGIMGGRDTEVGPGTSSLLLESASFDPVVVRRGSRSLGVASESSYRFERGVDLGGVVAALQEATRLLGATAGGTLQGVKRVGGIKASSPAVIGLDLRKAGDILSLPVLPARAKTILEKLGFRVKRGRGSLLKVLPPSFRRDVKIEEDLIEEIARVEGYDAIPLTTPSLKPFAMTPQPLQLLEARAREALLGMGLKEIVTYSLASEGDYQRCGLPLSPATLSLENPLSQDTCVLRTRLLPSLLQCAAFNICHGNRDFEFFEASRLYDAAGERVEVGIILGGKRRATWSSESVPYTFFDVKGATEAMLRELGAGALEVRPFDADPAAEKSSSAVLLTEGREIARIGKVSEEVCRAWGIKGRDELFFAEISLESLAGRTDLRKAYTPIVSTPSLTRDISLVAPGAVSYAKICGIIRDQAAGVLRSIRLVERYLGKEIPEGHQGLTIAVEYGSASKTLTDEEINPVHGRVLEALAQTPGLRLR
jgi:phenylalanyl-tRNA synthetase beta chain